MELFNNLNSFLKPDEEAELKFKKLIKSIYDEIINFTKVYDEKFFNPNSLPHLIIEFLDEEAIWSQLENDNKFFLKNYLNEFCQNQDQDEELDNFVKQDEFENLISDDSDNDSDVSNKDNSNQQIINETELEDEDLESEKLGDEDSADEELENEELVDEELENEELEDEELGDEEDDLNIIDDSDLDDEDDENLDDTLFKPSKNLNYEKELEKFDAENQKSEEENEEIYLSQYEKDDAEYKKKIKELEDDFLKEKPWQLKGEINASNRPQDSLLEEYVDFESGAKPVPVYTEEFNKKLEDIILQRIKTNKFDSVEQKERKVEMPFEFKRRILIDSEKSKDGLAKVYENEFLKQKGSSNQEENLAHKEIKDKMRKLFMQLDALCNFNYIPKASSSEIKVINNLPAINVEEALPEAISDATLIAPQEIIPVQKHDLKTDSEKSKTDKLRERRVKKRIIKEKIKLKGQNGLQNGLQKFKNKKNDQKVIKNTKDSEVVKNVFMKSRKK